MYEIEKYIHPEIEIYEREYNAEKIPSFKTLAEKANFKMDVEFEKGMGTGRIFDYEVPLEPPYEFYEHTNLTDIDLHFIGQGSWKPIEYPYLPLSHIKVLLNDEEQPKHLLSMLIGLTSQHHLSFEIVRNQKEISVYFSVPEILEERFLSQLYTFFPKSQFIVEEDDPLLEEINYSLEYGLSNPPIAPIRMINQPDSLSYLIGLLEEIDGFGFIQIMANVCANPWEINFNLCLKDRYKFEPIHFRDIDMQSLLMEKNKPPMFAVTIRTGFSNKEICLRLHRFTTIFKSTYQELIPTLNGYTRFDVDGRLSHHYGMLLSSEEFINLIYLPINIEGSIRYKKVPFIEMPPPESMTDE